MVIVTGCSGGGCQWWSLLQVALVTVVSGGHYSCLLGSGGLWWSLLQEVALEMVCGSR